MNRRPANAPILAAAAVLVTAIAFTRAAHAGPTASVDLDLGTSLEQGILSSTPVYTAPLYVVGFRVRAGWRFDVGPVWLLPEIGGGYDVERFPAGTGFTSSGTIGYPLPRVFGGARAGLSLPLAPALQLEPAVYGHVGYAHYWIPYEPDNALANDVGLSLDLRFLKYFLVGAQVGYEVVTLWQPGPTSAPSTPPSGSCMSAFGVPTPCSQVPPTGSSSSVATADKWISYGVHAGVLFW